MGEQSLESGCAEAPRKTSLIKFWVAVAGLLLIVGWWLTRPVRQRSKARHDVGEIQFALDGYAKLYGSLPAGDAAQIAAVLLGKDIREQDPKYAPILEAAGYELNPAGELIDPLGTPYRISLTPSVRVYSCGPNRVDEQGAGDDIASEG